MQQYPDISQDALSYINKVFLICFYDTTRVMMSYLITFIYDFWSPPMHKILLPSMGYCNLIIYCQRWALSGCLFIFWNTNRTFHDVFVYIHNTLAIVSPWIFLQPRNIGTTHVCNILNNYLALVRWCNSTLSAWQVSSRRNEEYWFGHWLLTLYKCRRSEVLSLTPPPL